MLNYLQSPAKLSNSTVISTPEESTPFPVPPMSKLTEAGDFERGEKNRQNIMNF
jgi:hypothetical protein